MRDTNHLQFRRKLRFIHALVIVSFIGLWVTLSSPFLGTKAPLISPLKLPPPVAVLRAATAVGPTGLGLHVGATLLHVLVGGLVGVIGGWSVGLAMSRSRTFAALLDPIIESVRPIPALAVFPLLILWLGIGFVAQMVVVAVATFSIIVIATYEAAIRVERRFVFMTRNFGGSTISELFFVLIPQTLPALIGALRICVALAFANAIGAEFLGAQHGLGYMIRNSRMTLNTAGIVVGTILIGALAVTVDISIRRFGRRSSRWLDSLM